MTTTTLMPVPKQQYFGIGSLPLVGGKVWTYAAGTTNKKATYTDAAGTVQQPNPIPLNARGEPASPIFWAGNYRVDVFDALGNLIYSVDNYNTDPNGILQLFSSAGSALIGFLQAGAGAVSRWVQDKLRDQVSVKDFGALGDGVTDDTAAIQAAINYAGTARTIFFPVGAYIVSGPMTLANGMKFKGEGDPTGANGAAIKVNAANYSNAGFQMFVKPAGQFQSAIFEGVRFLGGGNHFYFDLSTGSAYKIRWDDCVFQDSVGSHITGANAANGNGLLVCRHRGNSVINCGGFSSSGPINGTEISGGSWENMKGPALYVGDTGAYPNLKFTFTKNRIEGLYAGVNKGDYPVIQLDGKTYGADISDNYHENTFSKLLKVTNSRGVIYARNTHTDSALTVATLDIADSQVSIYDNYSLVGGTVSFTGTKCSVPRWGANQGFSIVSLYGKTSAATVDDPALLGSGGVSMAAYPGLFKGEYAKLKIVPVPAATGSYKDLFTIASGSAGVLDSRAVVSIRATLLLSVIDTTVGANMMMSQDVLITVWANAGGTMNSSITPLGSTASPNGTSFTVRQKAGATASALTIECAITNAALVYSGSSKIIAHYSYIADENNSSGLTLS